MFKKKIKKKGGLFRAVNPYSISAYGVLTFLSFTLFFDEQSLFSNNASDIVIKSLLKWEQRFFYKIN